MEVYLGEIYLYLPTNVVFAGFPGPCRFGIDSLNTLLGPEIGFVPRRTQKNHVVMTLLSP